MKIQFEPGDRVVVMEMYRSFNKTDKYENWQPLVGTIVSNTVCNSFDYAVRFDEVPPVVSWTTTKDTIWCIDQHQIDIFQQCCMEALADDK